MRIETKNHSIFPAASTEAQATNSFEIGSSIPVLKMVDEEKAKRFYMDFLGYQIDWEHRFEPVTSSSPLYMQIRLGESMIHLNGHADSDAPVAEVRIPVKGLKAYCDYLNEKCQGSERPEVVDPRYSGENQDMNIYDPSGNLLVFWLDKGHPSG
ncbi:glyoxalase superfamily protein [bacterium]|nr:glyoxalase superfamily protein [bacterium]